MLYWHFLEGTEENHESPVWIVGVSSVLASKCYSLGCCGLEHGYQHLELSGWKCVLVNGYGLFEMNRLLPLSGMEVPPALAQNAEGNRLNSCYLGNPKSRHDN